MSDCIQTPVDEAYPAPSQAKLMSKKRSLENLIYMEDSVCRIKNTIALKQT